MPFGCNALLSAFPELSAASETFSCDLNCALHLYACKGIRRARGAATHMSVEGAHLFLRNLTVEVGVEFCLPRLTNHGSSPLQSPPYLLLAVPVAAGDHAVFFSPAISATSPCL